MARLSKWTLAYRLLNAGYFSEYESANQLAKDLSWETLMTYYREMRDYCDNVEGMEYQLT